MKYAGIIVAMAAILTGCAKTEKDSISSTESIPVKTARVERSEAKLANTYVGTVEESLSLPLSFLTAGMVENVLVHEGECVKKGQLLASLEAVSYRSAYQAAEAKEKQATDAYNRLSSVYRNGSLPEVKMVEIETALEEAKAAERIAAKNLANCKLYSPASGVIGRKSIDAGVNVIPGTPAITVVKIDKVKVAISVPENEIAGIKIGQKAVITVPALDNAGYEGKVDEKGVMANPISHTYMVKVLIDNKNDMLRPGMVCNVTMNNNKSVSLVSIPASSVQLNNAGEKFVYVVDSVSATAKQKRIITGNFSANGNVAVTEGLSTGDMLVIEGCQKIHDNSPVQIIR
ncbi:MAG TPA: efflux RND transporter periplasmic adaptor subunit [Bacteroidales bacterium]|nr:efflux RND transporter periplasmic adaptor subunit [Bacteroidales bacterium]